MTQNIDDLFDVLAVEPPRSLCRKCGSKMMYLDTTFLSPGASGKVWIIPLPVCPKCDLKEDTARFISPLVC
jgi:hypothetical protein